MVEINCDAVVHKNDYLQLLFHGWDNQLKIVAKKQSIHPLRRFL